MGHLPIRWNALVAVLALATMVGCQGISTGKQDSQGGQDPPPGTLSAAPATINFGNVQIGTSQSQTETLTNTGGSSLTITQATFTGSDFSATGLDLPLILAPAQSATFSVIFTPTSGSASGSLVLTSDASSLTITLSGSGTVQQNPGQLSVSPTTIGVGNVTVGTSGTQTGSLNATGASVTVSAVSVGSSEFSITGLALPVTIPSGQSVNFTVTFTPQSSGLTSVSATFTSDASNSPTAATVTGTGVAAPVHTVNLTWTASTSPNIAGYNIYRSSSGKTGNYTQINTVLNATTTYVDTSVADGQTYYYETTAVNSDNEESAKSAAVQAVIPAP
jgi:hypothetical protein